MEDGGSLDAVLIEGEDYYFERGLMVFTARYHVRRGYCCERGCRHCPYDGEERNERTETGDRQATV
jgi:hypothetical protein